MCRWERRMANIKCPTCDGERFRSGPEGGGSVNISCGDCGDAFCFHGFGALDVIGRNEQVWGPRPEWPKWLPVAKPRRWFKKSRDIAVRTWPSGKREYGHITFVLTQPERV
jgi:hypothetical protein